VSSHELVPNVPPAGQSFAHLEHVAEQARDYAAAAKAPNTLRAYRSDWLHFITWCSSEGLDALLQALQQGAPARPAYAGGAR
jgi:hypothetical protein